MKYISVSVGSVTATMDFFVPRSADRAGVTRAVLIQLALLRVRVEHCSPAFSSLHFAGQKIRIRGRNLNAVVRPQVRLVEAIEW